ncbi:MAG: heat-shock protein, partial [Legionella sp. 21-45-4]
MESDTLQRFLFEEANIRGEILHLHQSYQTIIHQHPYPAAVKVLLGEAILACVLLTGSMKFEGEVSLQFQGDRRLPLLLVQCDHQLNVRALA